MFSEFGESQLRDLFLYIKKLEETIYKSNKKVIIWGLGKSGKFLTQLIENYTSVQIEFFIDASLVVYAKEPKIFRKTICTFSHKK